MDVLTAVPERGWVVSRCCWRHRAAASLTAGRLDQQLARGVAPESSTVLAARAQALTRMRTRSALARHIQRLLTVVSSGTVQPMLRPTCWRSVQAASPDFIILADELAAPGPVAAAGVAQASLLLSQTWGPGHRTATSLRADIAQARVALQRVPS